MGCCCTTLASINGVDAIPIIRNTELMTGRLEQNPEEKEGFLSNMVSEANSDRRTIKVSKVLLLYNPFSGNGLGNITAVKLEELLKAAKIEVTMKVSESPGHFTELSRSMDFTEYDCVAVCGGDGTINEFLQGVIERKLEIPVALCPGGTGNSLALALGIKTPADCYASIVSNSHIAVDCNRITDANGKTFYSINMIGAGLAHDANVRAEKLRCCGPMRYDCSALCLFCECYSRQMELVLDGHTLSYDSVCFFVMNNTTMGVGLHCAPFASITDGYFDVWLMPNMKFMSEVNVLGALKDGSHLYMPEGKNSLFRAKTMKVNFEGGINVDGENCAQGPCEIACMPSSWRLMLQAPEYRATDV